MKLIANIKLLPTPQQESLLRQTLERCNQACNYLSARASESGKLRQFDLHKLAYHDTRGMYDVAAQVAVRCISKVADAYKTGAEGQRTFKRFAAQAFDDRLFRFLKGNEVSIWTVAGRQKIAYVCGERQRVLLGFQKGEADLMFLRGKWYLGCVCDVPDPEEIGLEDVLGVDFGIVNLAVDSNGTVYSGAKIEAVRSKAARRRAGLQHRGTKAAKRKLRKLSGKQARFQTHENHCISKAIVAEAQRLRAAIAIEDLKGIRSRVKARRPQRARLHNWAFGQLRQFATYKARLAGVPLVAVDPRNTSRECPACGYIDKRNRPNQATFLCISCGHSAPADFNAARNIRARAAKANPALQFSDRFAA